MFLSPISFPSTPRYKRTPHPQHYYKTGTFPHSLLFVQSKISTSNMVSISKKTPSESHDPIISDNCKSLKFKIYSYSSRLSFTNIFFIYLLSSVWFYICLHLLSPTSLISWVLYMQKDIQKLQRIYYLF